MKKIPAWAVILAFAAVVGGAIGLVAYLRGRSVVSFCDGRLPSLPEYDRQKRAACSTHYLKRGSAVLVVQRRKMDFETRVRELESELQLPAQRVGNSALFETTVQATAAKRVGVVGGTADVVELHFDPAVFDRERALSVMRAL